MAKSSSFGEEAPPGETQNRWSRVCAGLFWRARGRIGASSQDVVEASQVPWDGLVVLFGDKEVAERFHRFVRLLVVGVVLIVALVALVLIVRPELVMMFADRIGRR
ncbi:hypothetical protein [Amycolatopsis sp. lyj-112]|uniref:hypothetical protein n=1 Tax=Amycolatopsis sp. lyj-112 TaxID=2789288 RepID=UPI00397DF688